VIQELLEGRSHLINLLDKNDSNNSLLNFACEHHHLPVVSWLLQQPRLLVNISNQEGKTAFFVACEKGFTDIVKVMLLSNTTSRPPLSLNTGSSHQFPMSIACKNGHAGVVKEILEHGGDVVDVNRLIRGSALTNACDSGNTEILELLLNDPKIDVNQKIFRGSTLLHHVCQKNQLPQLQRVLQVPTLDFNQQSDLGSTPLMVACQYGSVSIVSELLKYKKVNPNLCDSTKRTALWFAKEKTTLKFLSILCTPHWVIDTTTKPEGEEYPSQYANYLVEYARDTDKFRKKYGTQSYEPPHSRKIFRFFSHFL